MIVLTLPLDNQGRPIIGLFASVSRPRLEALEAASENPPRPVAVRAMIDTGASHCVLASSIVKSLELEPVGFTPLATVSSGGSPILSNKFAINLFFAGRRGATLDDDLPVVEVEDLNGLEVDMLLGRDFLERCLLIYTGTDLQFTLAFAPPTNGS